jgi:voltage-gated cation channel
MRDYITHPALLYALRIFRIFQSIRFLKLAKGIRKLLHAFLISLPALFNIATLLLLIIFIYAIIGMNLFMNVKLQNSLTSNNNFQTFGKSFIILFRLSTFSSWHKVLNALMLTNNDPGSNCSDTYDIQSLPFNVDPRKVNGKIFIISDLSTK